MLILSGRRQSGMGSRRQTPPHTGLICVRADPHQRAVTDFAGTAQVGDSRRDVGGLRQEGLVLARKSRAAQAGGNRAGIDEVHAHPEGAGFLGPALHKVVQTGFGGTVCSPVANVAGDVNPRKDGASLLRM